MQVASGSLTHKREKESLKAAHGPNRVNHGLTPRSSQHQLSENQTYPLSSHTGFAKSERGTLKKLIQEEEEEED